MADEIAKIVVAVDSTSAQAAAKDLDNLTGASRRAEQATGGFTEEQLRAAGSVRTSAAEIERVNQKLDHMRDRAIAAAMAARKLAEEERAAAAATTTATKGAKGHGDALGGLSLMSGQAAREYAVLINEMQRGDFTRLQGSLITLGNRIGLMPMLFTATGAAVAGVAAVVGTLAVAAAKGSMEQADYNRQMIATGEVSGITYGKMLQMAHGMEDATTSIGTAKEALIAVTSSGRFFHEQIQEVAQGVVDFAHVTGSSIQDAAKEFIKLREDPLRAVTELDKTMNFLTVTVRDQIRTLQEHGQIEQAAALAERTLSEAMSQRAKDVGENLGYLQKRWNELSNAASKAWDTMMGLGRDKTMTDNLKAATERMQALQASVRNADPRMANRAGQDVAADWAKAIRIPHTGNDDLHFYTVELNKQIALVNTLSGALKNTTGQDAAAAAQAQTAAATKENTAAMHEQLLAIDRKAQRENALAQLEARFAQAKKDGTYGSGDFTEANHAKLISDIEHRYRDYRVARVAATEAEKAAKKEENAHDQQLKTLDQTIAAHRQVVDASKDSSDKLSETEKWAIRQKQQLADEYTHLTKAEIDERIAKIDGIVATDRANQARMKEAATVEDATRALERYQKVGSAREIQNQRQLDSVGHSSEWAAEQARIYQIIDDAENARIQLTDKARAAEQLESQAYKDGLQNIAREMDQQLGRERKFYDDRKAAMGDWRNGAQRAWEEFANKANDVAGQTYDSFNTAFSGMEQAIDQFSKTGKFKFGDFARSVLAELAKIELRIILSKILMSIFGSSTTSGGYSNADGSAGSGAPDGWQGTWGFAKGGAFQGGQQLTAYANGGLVTSPTLFPMANGGTGLAGEAGTEGLLPLGRMPDGKLGIHSKGGGGIQYNVATTVVLNGDGTSKTSTTGTSDNDQRQAKILGEFLSSRVKEILVDEQRQGGILWRMNNG